MLLLLLLLLLISLIHVHPNIDSNGNPNLREGWVRHLSNNFKQGGIFHFSANKLLITLIGALLYYLEWGGYLLVVL